MNDSSDPIALARDFLVFQQELGVEVVPLLSENAPTVDRPDSLEAFESVVLGCRACGLCEARNNVVFGSGNPYADVMFIGEAPGKEEDLQGVPFVGAAGELLTKMISGIKLDRNDVYIANIIKKNYVCTSIYHMQGL